MSWVDVVLVVAFVWVSVGFAWGVKMTEKSLDPFDDAVVMCASVVVWPWFAVDALRQRYGPWACVLDHPGTEGLDPCRTLVGRFWTRRGAEASRRWCSSTIGQVARWRDVREYL